MITRMDKLKDILAINIKPRDDNIFDQYNRIFMMKLLLVCTIICGVGWYKDPFYCNVPAKSLKSSGVKGFVAPTCWMQGLYVYRALQNRTDYIAYYGIGVDIDEDGMYEGTNILCKTQPRLKMKSDSCKPLEKTFFLQYQYLPFLMATLSFLYYLPYVMFKSVNDDIVKLQAKIKSNATSYEIFRLFFKKRDRRVLFDKQISSRHLQFLAVKILYIGVNVAVFVTFDYILEGYFFNYGLKWITWWYKSDEALFYDYMGSSDAPRPANELLPPFGYCEILSSSKQVVSTKVNSFKVICTLTQHVLYQYVFILLWFCVVLGCAVSSVGLLLAIWRVIMGLFGLRKIGKPERIQKIYKCVTNREIDYLQMIKTHDIAMHGELIGLLLRCCEKCKSQALNPCEEVDLSRPGSRSSPVAEIRDRAPSPWDEVEYAEEKDAGHVARAVKLFNT